MIFIHKSFKNFKFLQIASLDNWNAGLTFLPVVVCSKSKIDENFETFPRKPLFPQHVPPEKTKALLTALPISFVRVTMKYHLKCESNNLKMIFPKKWTFLHNVHWVCKKQFWRSCQKIFAWFLLHFTNLHLFKKYFSSKFLPKRRMHFWLACWNSCCQKLHYGIAQSEQLIIKVGLFQKMCCIKIVFFWTRRTQFWKPCSKRLAKHLTCFFAQIPRMMRRK